MLVRSIIPNYQNKNYNNNYMTKNNPAFQAAIPKPVPSLKEMLAIAQKLDQASFALKTGACTEPADMRNLYTQLLKITNDIGKKAGFKELADTPRMVQTDAYYVSSNFYIHQDAKDHSVYQIAFRREELPWMKDLGVKKEDRKLIFHGLQDIIDDVLHNPVTREEIEESETFYKEARNKWQYKWDRGMWEKILSENNGIIPIKIQALPDGSTVFPGEAVIQVQAQDGYGELAAWFETRLIQVWAASERASMLRHWLDYNKNMIRNTSDKHLTDAEILSKAQKMLVDFSDRSGICPQESERLGKASMLVFPVNSTVSAAYKAYKQNGNIIPGSLAMPSLPHRVVESYEHEGDAYKALARFTKGGMGSYVADCYDFRRAVKEELIPLALKAQKENKELGINTIINARPDSGDPYEEIKYVLDLAVQNGMYREIKTRDGRILKGMTVLRGLQADGMTFKKMMEINERLIKDGYSPADCLSYGVGGFLHDAISRSNMSCAQKLAEVGKGKRKRPVMKCPIDEPAKESIPGAVKLVREENSTAPTLRRLDEEGKDAYIVWYDGINGHGIEYNELFANVQKRAIEEFDKYQRPDNIYSPGIIALKEQIRDQHRGNQ